MPGKITKITWNIKGFNQVRKSQGVASDIQRRAQAIHRAAGGDDAGFEWELTVGGSRARASVRTGTYKARVAEAIRKTLTSAIGAGR